MDLFSLILPIVFSIISFIDIVFSLYISGQDWLLIYDNWQLPFVYRESAALMMHKLLINIKAFEEFDRIFVLSDHELCIFALNEKLSIKVVDI